MPKLHTMHINLTRSCNLGCLYCYARAIRGKANELTLSLIAALAKDISELGARRVILSGGEPMSHPRWREIARIFDDSNMEVSLATNGTLITPAVVAFLQSIKRATISVSIDGDAATHDLLRDTEGAYERTCAGCDY